MKQFAVAVAAMAIDLSGVRPTLAQAVDQYGGYTVMPSPRGGTGFFRVEKFGNRWMFVTPEGHALWMAGVYALDSGGATSDQGIGYDQIIAQKYPDKPT